MSGSIIEYVRIYLQVYFITVDIAFVTAVKEKKSTNHLTVAILLNVLYLKHLEQKSQFLNAPTSKIPSLKFQLIYNF